MDSKKQLIHLIGKEKYDDLYAMIPPDFVQDIQINYSEYLLQKREQEILSFYSLLTSDNNQWSVTKIVGSIVILTSHVDDLLKRLVEKRESDLRVVQNVNEFKLHNLILFCVARYEIPKEHFLQMMELKHFRNMIAHDFNSIMETSFHQAINPISESFLLIIFLTQLLKS